MLRKKWLAAASITALTLTIAACSTQDDQSQPPTAGCGSGQTVTVNLPNPTQPTSLDPNYDTIVNFAQVSRNMFDGLFKLNNEMEIEPNLATGFTQPDSLTYDIALKDDVKFHNGSPFTSADVVSTFNRIPNDTELASKQKSYVANIASVTATDNDHVRFTLKKPDASFIKILATLIYITPASVKDAEGNAAFGKNPAGTGPFKLEKWNEGDSIVLAANCDYHGDAPIPSRVEFRFIAEPATAISSLQSGEIDIAAAITPDLAATLQSNRDLAVRNIDGNISFWLTINTLEGPFSDQRVRQALNYGVDKKAITESLLGGNATPRGQLYSADVFGAASDVDAYAYDPEQARKLLKEAGYSDGEVKVDLVIDREDLKPVVQAVAANLGNSGFKVTTSFSSTFISDSFLPAKMGANQVFFISNTNLLMDADYALGLHLDGARRGIYFHTPETDAAIAEARGIDEPAARQKAYDKLTAELREIAPVVFLYNTKAIYGTNNQIDWQPRPDGAIYLADVTKTS